MQDPHCIRVALMRCDPHRRGAVPIAVGDVFPALVKCPQIVKRPPACRVEHSSRFEHIAEVEEVNA